MFRKLFYTAFALLTLTGVGYAATVLNFSFGPTWVPAGPALFQGSDFQTLTDAVNTLRNQADGTTAGTYKGVYNGTVGATTPSTGVFTTVSASGTFTPTGGIAPAAGFTIDPSADGNTCQHPAMVSTDGTDVTPAVTETFVAPVNVRSNETITGVRLFNGSATAGNVTIGLADSTGAPITAALTASTALSGTDAYQTVPFAAPYAAKGPATYYVQVQYNNTGARLNAIVFATCNTVKQTSQTYGTMASFTPPTTFTASVGPYASLY